MAIISCLNGHADKLGAESEKLRSEVARLQSELDRFRQERGYIIGWNDGYEHAQSEEQS